MIAAVTRLLGAIRARIRLWLGFGRAEQRDRLDEEIRFHLDQEAAHQVEAGLTPNQARRAARIAFGGEARVRADAMDEVRSRSIEELRYDVRLGARSLRRSPGFTIVALVTFALGLGATTVFFSLADHVVLRSLPYPDAGRLYVIQETIKEYADKLPFIAVNAGHFVEWRRRCAVCSDLATTRGFSATMTVEGEPRQLAAARVTANFLTLLGGTPALGRLFLPEEDLDNGRKIVVLSDGLWRRLGADPSIVGKTIVVNEASLEVVGVLNRDFRFPKEGELGWLLLGSAELFTPLALTPPEIASPGAYDYVTITRLAVGRSWRQVEDEINGIEKELSQRSNAGTTVSASLVPMRDQVVGSVARALLLLLGAVGAVLLLVSVNLANLFLARNLRRNREWAVRVALGGSSGRLVRQTLSETLLVAFGGGALGVALSYWGLRLLIWLAPANLPRLSDVRLDARVIIVVLLVTVMAGIGFGVVPAIRSSRTDPADALRGGGRSNTEGKQSRSGQTLLIGFQAALCALLLAATGLFLTSFVRVSRVDKGFDVGPVLAVDLSLPVQRYLSKTSRVAFFDDLLGRLETIPGVRAVSLATGVPLEGERQVDLLWRDHETRKEAELPIASIRVVSPAYFSVVGTPLRQGRLLEQGDRGRPVVVVSERAASELWPGESPIGRRILPGSNDSLSEVVGIVSEIRTNSLERAGTSVAYLPYWASPPFEVAVLLRTDGNPERVIGPVRAILREVGPTVPITKIRTLPEVLRAATAPRRFQLSVLIAFAITAVLTAAVGIYGIVAHTLTARRSEIGLRIALGASPARVERQVVGEGLRPVLVGLGVGLVAAIVIGRTMAGLLFEVRPTDPPTLLGVSAVLLLVALLACWIPARRAAREGALLGLRAD